MADLLRQRGERMQWYRDELLHMAKELGHRLLPAFNTTSGLPYPKALLLLLFIVTEPLRVMVMDTFNLLGLLNVDSSTSS